MSAHYLLSSVIIAVASSGWPPSFGFARDATIEVRVVDEQDAALDDATVTVKDTTGTFSKTAVTDTAGGFRLSPVPPGVYTVSVVRPGFQSHDVMVELEPAMVRELTIRLGLSPVSQRVDVVAASPLLGSGMDRSLLPTTISVLAGKDLSERQAASFADTLNERLGAVTLEGASTNIFQPTLRFRGFAASPLLGLPQGVAVYQNGARINEPFGDTVQFDLIPQFALANVQLSSGSEPIFGLNALGGALALRLKSGFDAEGFRAEISGGSFERIIGTAELGVHRGPWALYAGATRFSEAGWRQQSASNLVQAVADVGYRRGRLDAGVSVSFADTSLNGNGPAPEALLRVDRTAVFTYPDTTENRLGFVQGRFNVALSPTWSLQLNGFFRDLERNTLNADEAELGVCDDGALPTDAPPTTLCAGREGDEGEAMYRVPIVDVLTGRFITQQEADGDGAINRSSTVSQGYGASVQAVASSKLSGHGNVFIVGASVDLADVAFASDSEVGTLTRDRTVDGSGMFAGVFMKAPDDIFNTSLNNVNRAIGLYFSDTLSLDRFHITVSGRFNDARVTIHDQLGASLDGDHRFVRFNPSMGFVLETSSSLSVFARYSESNRTPTAAELSCADPSEPCRVPNAFISDPPLQQAVARSLEAGLRGAPRSRGAFEIEWSAAAYRTGIGDDILFVASPELIGTGYFQNAGDTRRAGVDLEVVGRGSRFGWYLSYGFVDATFQSPLFLPGDPEVHAAATPEGEIRVEPGDRIPGIPRHSLKLGGQVDLSDDWYVAVEGVLASDRYFVGDEGNDQPPLRGYGILNLRSAYALGEDLELFLRMDNLFDTEYATFGILAEVGIELQEISGTQESRFVSPGAPRSIFGGVRVRF